MNNSPTDGKSWYQLLAPVLLNYQWHYLFHGNIPIVDCNLFLGILIFFFIIISDDDESLFVLLTNFTRGQIFIILILNIHFDTIFHQLSFGGSTYHSEELQGFLK